MDALAARAGAAGALSILGKDPHGAGLAADDPRWERTPGRFCDDPASGVSWLYSDGTMGFVRCGASNRCDYCAMLAACENALVVRLDATDGGDFPSVGITTTTRDVGVDPRCLARPESYLWRDLRRGAPSLAYCGFLEWTTGWYAKGRRPHVHHLVKRLEYDESLEARVSELWRKYSPDHAWRVEARPLRTPLGAIAYLVLHHHKREQAPPPGTRHVKRLRPSRGYFGRPVGELRAVARELLKDERLYAELVRVLEVPDGAPSYLVDELVAEHVDAARERAQFEQPVLVHVRERVRDGRRELLHVLPRRAAPARP